jgi:hypothetical protein
MMRRSSADRHGPELPPNNSMQRTRYAPPLILGVGRHVANGGCLEYRQSLDEQLPGAPRSNEELSGVPRNCEACGSTRLTAYDCGADLATTLALGIGRRHPLDSAGRELALPGLSSEVVGL